MDVWRTGEIRQATNPRGPRQAFQLCFPELAVALLSWLHGCAGTSPLWTSGSVQGLAILQRGSVAMVGAGRRSVRLLPWRSLISRPPLFCFPGQQAGGPMQLCKALPGGADQCQPIQGTCMCRRPDPDRITELSPHLECTPVTCRILAQSTRPCLIQQFCLPLGARCWAGAMLPGPKFKRHPATVRSRPGKSWARGAMGDTSFSCHTSSGSSLRDEPKDQAKQAARPPSPEAITFPSSLTSCPLLQFGESQQLRLVRILRSTLMVRVGGGWIALDEFLVKNDPCRGEWQEGAFPGLGPTSWPSRQAAIPAGSLQHGKETVSYTSLEAKTGGSAPCNWAGK